MISVFKNIFYILFLAIPLFLITGPAIPDLIISLGVIFALVWLIIIQKNYIFFNSSFINISLIFWLSLIIISFFAYNKAQSFQDSIIFVRFLLIPISIYFLFFTSDKDIKKILLLIFICFIATFFTKELSINNLFIIVLIFSCFYLFISSLSDLIYKKKNLSQNISHFAFSILILSIIFNGILSKEYSGNMKVGDEVNFNSNIIKFKKIETFDKKNYKSIIATFEIEDRKKQITLLKPEIRAYNQPKTLTSEADIKTNFFEDKFLVFSILNKDNIFNVRYQVKPFMIWIWLSTFLLIFGGLIRFTKIK